MPQADSEPIVPRLSLWLPASDLWNAAHPEAHEGGADAPSAEPTVVPRRNPWQANPLR